MEVPLTSVVAAGSTVLDASSLGNVNLVVSNANSGILPPAAFISSPQKDLDALTNNLLMQQSVSVASNPILTMVPEQQTVLLQNLQQTQLQAAGNYQGIPPGLSSSMILTPTVMSQVQPTPTIQAINLAEGLVTTNISSGLESIIMTPAAGTTQETLQTFNTLTATNPIAAAGNLTIPLQQTSSYLPSTITIDPNVLKKQNITIDPALLTQNVQLQPTSVQPVTVPSSNQCILVDGNLVALASGGLPVQQVLVSADVLTNQSVMVNNVPQNVTTLPVNQVLQQQQQQLLQQIQQHQTPAPERQPTVPKTPIKTVKLSKQQTVASTATPKKTKTIQSISTLSPESSVFNQVKSSKGASPLVTSSGKNVIITKKTINVIKKSEGQVIPMKPTSVEQVQPGVFKFQLKKVNSTEAAALLQSSSTTTNTSSLAELFQSGNNIRGGVPNLQKIGRSAIKMSTANPAANKTNSSSSNSSSPFVSGISIKTSNLPKDMLSKLKDLNKFRTIKVSSPNKSFTFVGSSSKEAKRTTVSPQQLPKKVVLQTISSKTAIPIVKVDGKSSNTSSTALSTVETSRHSVAKPVQANNIKVNGKSTKSSIASSSAEGNRYIITKPAQGSNIKPDGKSTNTPPSTSRHVIINPTHPVSALKQSKTSSESPVPVARKVVPIPKGFPHNVMNCRVSVKDATTITRSDATSNQMIKQANANSVKEKAATVILDQLNGKVKLASKRSNSIDAELSSDVVADNDLTCEERILVSPTDDNLTTTKRKPQLDARRSAGAINALTTMKIGRTVSNVKEIKLPRIEKGLPVLEKAREMLKKAKTASASSITTPVLAPTVPARDLSPREKSEMETIREAITSSRVGLQEVNMRELAVQEIEKQLKRFSTGNNNTGNNNTGNNNTGNKKSDDTDVEKKENSNNSNSKCTKKLSSPDSTTDVGGKKLDERIAGGSFHSNNLPDKTELKRKSSPTGSSSVSSSGPAEKKTKVGDEKLPSAKSNFRKAGKKRKSQSVILDENRKRERPKKYDDFILAADPKREKEKKSKKFFFPKEDNAAEKTSPSGELALPDDEKRSGIFDLASSEDEQECESKNESINNKPKPKSQNRNTDDEIPGSSKRVACKNNSTKKKQSQKGTEKNGKKTKKRKQKKAASIAFEPETLPEHLKTKSKTKVEDTVLDLTKVKLKSSFTETSFVLSDIVENKTSKLLEGKNLACTLCGRPGNLGSLDVLFGPYKINVRRKNASNAETTSGKKKKNASASENEDPLQQQQQQMNVWLHRDCAIWTSNICLSNQTLCGLGESLDEAATTVCLASRLHFLDLASFSSFFEYFCVCVIKLLFSCRKKSRESKSDSIVSIVLSSLLRSQIYCAITKIDRLLFSTSGK